MRKEILIGVGIEVPSKNWAEVVKETVIPYKPTRIISNKPIEIITYSPKPTQKRLLKRKRKAKTKIKSPTLSGIRK